MKRVTLVLAALALFGGGGQARAGSIVAWGDNTYGAVSKAPTAPGFTAVAGSVLGAVALKSDGSIVAWGDNYLGTVSNAPTSTGFTAVAGDGYTDYALRSDGSIVAWGYNDYGTVSNAPTGTDFTAVAGGFVNGLAIQQTATLAPEPTSLSLFVLGALGMTGFTYRRRKSAAASGVDQLP